METKIFALIQNGRIENTIVATQEFADSFGSGDGASYEAIVALPEPAEDIPQPGIGWLYSNGAFTEAGE
jgi:hypothetical protein